MEQIEEGEFVHKTRQENSRKIHLFTQRYDKVFQNRCAAFQLLKADKTLHFLGVPGGVVRGALI